MGLRESFLIGRANYIVIDFWNLYQLVFIADQLHKGLNSGTLLYLLSQCYVTKCQLLF